MEHVFDPNVVLPPVRHSRMLLAGIQAESGLDPRLKHSGVTVLESHLFAAAAIFKGVTCQILGYQGRRSRDEIGLVVTATIQN